jgi:hypothetical protein
MEEVSADALSANVFWTILVCVAGFATCALLFAFTN